jgi:hypothetical protein
MAFIALEILAYPITYGNQATHYHVTFRLLFGNLRGLEEVVRWFRQLIVSLAS